MIKLTNINKRFPNVLALDNVSIEIHEKEIVCLLGPSGSGKSTLLRCINGLEIPDHGQVFVDDQEIDYHNDKQMQELRTKLGFVFQSFNLFPHKKVIDNITLGPINILGLDKVVAEENALKLLHRIGLQEKAYEYPNKLSGGQKQRVAIARACMLDPSVLCFDEPTSALDYETTKQIIIIIRRLAATGMSVVIVTHDDQFVEDIAERVIVLKDQGINEIEIDKPQ